MLTVENVAPEGWTVSPVFHQKGEPDLLTLQLVHEILRQGDRAGTDIKLDVGIPFKFKAFPRSGLRTSYFKWRLVHGYRWNHIPHISYKLFGTSSCDKRPQLALAQTLPPSQTGTSFSRLASSGKYPGKGQDIVV